MVAGVGEKKMVLFSRRAFFVFSCGEGNPCRCPAVSVMREWMSWGRRRCSLVEMKDGSRRADYLSRTLPFVAVLTGEELCFLCVRHRPVGKGQWSYSVVEALCILRRQSRSRG